MLLKYTVGEAGQLIDPNNYGGLLVSEGKLECLLRTPISIVEDNAIGRLEDIASAYESGDVRVYDLNKAVGYWKPKPARAKKPAAKKAAPPPEEPKA